jgi:hypothetical protein
MTAATGLYRRIRASTERARDRIGLDQSDDIRQSRPGIPARRTARGKTECDRRCRSPMMASRSRARSWSVAMRNGGDGLGPDVYLRCTYRVPRIDLRPASRPVDPPAASGSCRSEAASAVLAPHRIEAGYGEPTDVGISKRSERPGRATVAPRDLTEQSRGLANTLRGGWGLSQHVCIHLRGHARNGNDDGRR